MLIHKIHHCTGHNGAIYALASDKHKTGFYSAGGDGWVVRWALDSPDTGKVVATIQDRIFSMLLLDNPDRIVAGNMTGGLHWIALDDTGVSSNVLHHRKGVFDVVLWNGWVLSAGGDGILTRWSAAEGKTIESLQLTGMSLRCIATIPQSSLIAIGASDGNIYIVEVNEFRLVKTLESAHTNTVFSLAASPDGQTLFSGGRDAMLRQWHLVKSEFVQQAEIAAHWYTINHIALRPDGRYFATASRDKTVKIWESATCRLLKVLDTIRDGGHINSVNRLLWLSDRLLVSASDDRSAIIWSVEPDV